MNAKIYKTENGRDILNAFHDEMTRQRAYPHEAVEVPTRHGATYTVTAGSRANPALVLLHGSASSILGWGAAIPEYMRDYFVIAPDIPGEAGKSEPVRPSWDNDDYVQWLDDLLRALAVERAALLGISFGGWLALKYAAARPGRVSRIVLLAPGGLAPARASAVFKTIVYSMQGQKGSEKMKRMVFGGGEILPEVSRFFDLLQQHYAPRFGSPPPLTDAELQALTCPALMAAGGGDAFFDSEKAAARLKKLVPVAQIMLDAEGQHGITQYGGTIAQFLAQQA